MSETRPSLRIGCAGLPTGIGRDAYFEKLRFLEVDPAAWKKRAPEGSSLSILAPPALLAAGPAAWPDTRALAEKLGAEAVVFSTPAAFTPTTSNREAMKKLFGEVDRGDLTLVWEPRGIWEPGQAARLAVELDVVYAHDPLQLDEPPPPTPVAYYKLYGLGLHRNRVSDEQLELLMAMLGASEAAWVVFANGQKWSDAQRFQQALLELAAGDDDDE